MTHSHTIGSERHPGRFERLVSRLTLAVCISVLLYKLFVATRININWDEFWYLNFVHTLLRNELTLILQGAYTHLFTWLPMVGANEVDQVVAARIVMLALLGLTAWLIWRLSTLWFDGFAAVAPPFIYLTMIPVLMHGGSFRSDSMLAPLLMTATLLLALPGRSHKRDVLAGIAIGLAATVTIKVLLFAPMLFVLMLSVRRGDTTDGQDGIGPLPRIIFRVSAAAAIVAGIAITAHSLAISGSDNAIPSAIQSESVTRFAARTATTTVIDAGLFPRGSFLKVYANWQPLPWLLITLGAIAAACRRRFDMLALAMAMLPVTFYRNAYPYFYVVMLAPASVLAGYSIATLNEYVAAKGPAFARPALTLVLAIGLAYQGLVPAPRFLQDNQSTQRAIVAAVHEIFPGPVNYIDRCGMISSFRKVNFFMSTWGIANYRDAATPVMASLAAQAQPAFLLVNSPTLMTGRSRANGLLEADRDFLQRTYSPYWGPIKVAGGSGRVSATGEVTIHVPFAAKYRLKSPVPVLIDGERHEPGELIAVSHSVAVRLIAGSGPQESIAVKLVLATAMPPRQSVLPPQEIFTGL